MNDLISKQAALEALVKVDCSDGIKISPLKFDAVDDAITAIKALPPAQQEQIAEWVPSTKYKGFWVCSACEDCYIEGWSDKERKWRYCPQCGKRMKREGV